MYILSNMGKDQEFLEAARNGNITVVENILNQKAKRSGPFASLRRGPGANVQDASGYSALHHAALNGHTDIVHLLLAHDASPNLPDSRGSSPLHLAAWAGHQDIVKLFLIHSNRPANPNSQTIENETPLHYAAQHGHTGALTTLLAHGADPNVMNSRNETPLDLAAQYGRLEVVQMLIRAHSELLLQFKSENRSLTSTGCEKPIIFDHTPLHLASRNGHKSVVEVLLTAGVDVNVLTLSGTALHEAALCGKDSIVRTLLDFGADLDATNCEGRTALDILQEFPSNVTKGIVSVINSHRNSMIYDSESDGIRDTHVQKHHAIPMSLRSSSENNRVSPVQNYLNSNYRVVPSPSSSLGSLGPSSSSSKPRTLITDLPKLYVTMTPIKQRKATAPKKPPRRNLSMSPTHLQTHKSIASTNVHNNSNIQKAAAYEYICMARTGKKTEEKMNRAISFDQYVEMNASKPVQPRNIIHVSNENTTLKSYNPNRKLRRNRNIYESFNIDFNSERIANENIPQIPTSYQQLPTPEHPPPTAVQAEKCIHERMRPFSQEHKRQSGLQNNFMTESSTSPELVCSSLCASSGSISSSVSISDQSISTDCVEEFIGDVPFAGLFKGSTVNLNNANSNYSQRTSRYIESNQHDKSISSNSQEKPITLQTSKQNQDTSKQCYQKDYKNRLHSFGGVFDNDCKDIAFSICSDIISSNCYYKDQSVCFNDDNVTDIHLIEQYDNDERENLRAKLQNDFKAYLSRSAKSDAENKSDKSLLLRNDKKCENMFDEKEAWTKISEIMESFGSEFVTIRDKNSEVKSDVKDLRLTKILKENNLQQCEKILIENGFDNIEFLNGILDELDLNTINIPSEYHEKLLQVVKKLPIPQSLPFLHKENNNTILIVDQWLQSICLDEYIDIFKQNLYTNMERVYRLWEVECQTVLEINKLGHRKRISHSISNNCVSQKSSFDELNIDINTLKTNIIELQDDFMEKLPEKSRIQHSDYKISSVRNVVSGVKYNKKNRPAPKPPIRESNIEIRAPSELLLGLPSNLQTKWRHTANSLINSFVEYDAYYLGSTIVKELRGTESTRKSIQKLKKDDRLLLSTPIVSKSSINTNNQQQVKKQPIRLSISYRGVEFIDIEAQKTMCEHAIRNINYACQDADDLSHFAYVTKDSDITTHYCHVFNVDSMDLATEIILTIGQAFEVAYQLALRDASNSASINSMNNYKILKH